MLLVVMLYVRINKTCVIRYELVSNSGNYINCCNFHQAMDKNLQRKLEQLMAANSPSMTSPGSFKVH